MEIKCTTFAKGTVYEGGTEYEHVGCSCKYGRHVETIDGYVIPSIMYFDDRETIALKLCEDLIYI